MSLLSAPEMIVFTAALALMLLIGLVEALGLGISSSQLGADLDGGDGGLLAWLGFGEVPFLALLVAFLATFGTIGLAGQQIALSVSGSLLSPLLMVPVALLIAVPVSSLLARLFGRFLPRDETTAIALEELVGRTATIVVGRAARGSAARARAVDPHGQVHHILVEPDEDRVMFDEGQTILLVRREAQIFRAIVHEPHRLSNWIIQ